MAAAVSDTSVGIVAGPLSSMALGQDAVGTQWLVCGGIGWCTDGSFSHAQGGEVS